MLVVKVTGILDASSQNLFVSTYPGRLVSSLDSAVWLNVRFGGKLFELVLNINECGASENPLGNRTGDWLADGKIHDVVVSRYIIATGLQQFSWTPSSVPEKYFPTSNSKSLFCIVHVFSVYRLFTITRIYENP